MQVADGTRTRDHRDHNPELYQLSYRHLERGQCSRTGRVPRERTLLLLASLAAVTVAGAQAGSEQAFPATIRLPEGFQPEGIAIAGTPFYVGSIPNRRDLPRRPANRQGRRPRRRRLRQGGDRRRGEPGAAARRRGPTGKDVRLFQNSANKIARIALSPNLGSGRITGFITDSDYDVPTTIDELGTRLYAVNARFSTTPTPTTPYDVVRVAKR